MTIATMNTMLCSSEVAFAAACPATAALEEEQRKLSVTKGDRAGFESKLSNEFGSLHFDNEDVNSFPAIEWESDDSDSDSVRSLDNWNALLNDPFDSSGSLRKRSRSDSSTGRRLVRSKKIKSDLSSLAVSVSI